MISELVLFVLLVILVLFWIITYAPSHPSVTFPSKKAASAKSRSKALPTSNVRARLIFETSAKKKVFPEYESSPASTNVIVGSSSKTPLETNDINEKQHDRHDETDRDREDSDRETNATDTRDMHFGSEDICDYSHEKDSDSINEDDSHLYEQKIFEASVDRRLLDEYVEKSGRLCGLMDYISYKKEEWKKMKLNIAITGNSGTGKSSLINALMGLRPNEKGAAKVGITETTTEIKSYPYRGKENLVLWDLPGMGTQSFKKNEYLSKFDIAKFEVFIIVTATRFTENDIWLAKKLLKREKYVFFIRTKIDIDLENEKHDHPDSFDSSTCLQTVKEEIELNLKKAKIFSPHTKVYVVSSRDRSEYDFEIMFEKLKNIINNKAVSLSELLEQHLAAATENEKTRKKELFSVEKVVTGIAKFLPFELEKKINLLCIRNTLTACERAFCIDDASLERVSKEVGITIKCLKEDHMKCSKKYKRNQTSFLNVLLRLQLAIGKFNRTSYYVKTLHDICDTLAEDECTLILLRIKKLEEELLPM